MEVPSGPSGTCRVLREVRITFTPRGEGLRTARPPIRYVRIENSFIPVRGVGPATERDLWDRGVVHWDAFERDVLSGTRGERIESFIAEASPRLDDGDAAFFDERFPSGERWRLYENFRDAACFFDIETTGLSRVHDEVTTVSFHRDGETTTLVRGRDLTRRRVREQFAAADLLVTFNGARFDVPFLERAFGLDVRTPHLDLMYPCRRLDLTGGLKAIEREVGIERASEGVDGADAVRLWHAYQAGDDGALETLVRYNREDAAGLRALAEIVVNRLSARRFPG